MPRQRNKIAKLAPELRELVSRLLHEGALTYSGIQAKLAEAGVAKAAMPGLNAFTAWMQGAEYKTYVAAKQKWDEKMTARRWATGLLFGEQGAVNAADMAELAILEQLHRFAVDGGFESGKDAATVARAITALQRTQLAKIEQKRKADAAAKAEKLKGDLAGKKEISLADVAAAMDELVGVK